ncbi:hypothetical protein [Janthinobacterium sp. 17J80-10]|uniref:hypothetical protein n=1 Tax=Janthinobacterium sp. 17J80-10 TaxID=2497863 RepID=UPI0010055374|nr:hypothetical protein [Janthinobacterium sp. 17J80-10]QAU33224.1 hypothetical protein EKL02_02965 [Janthinobacterium sp. 17J80-10]
MLDAREVDPRKDYSRSAIHKPVPFSPFRYLALMVPIPLLAWYWAGEALHKLELDWLRSNPGQVHSLADVCQASSAGMCALYAPATFTHWLALGLLMLIPKFMLLTASLPGWPPRWQERILRNASWLGAIGLLLTLAMVMTRGLIAAMTVWFVPHIWWGNDTVGLQLAVIIGIIAVIRVPPHVLAAWRLWRGFSKTRTGKPVTAHDAPSLWMLVHETCRRIGVAAPDHLVMGVAPDCRLELGKMRLEPARQVLDGRILYLGATLASALERQRLEQVVEHALLKSRGKFGEWLPAVQDWVESSEGHMKMMKEARSGGNLSGATDPALLCWEGWLVTLKKMLENFREEHAYEQKIGMEYEVEQTAPAVAAILSEASLAYRKDVFHLFVVDLSSGVHCPAVLTWFQRAFRQRMPGDVAANVHTHTSAALETELVLLEKEWLVKTSQASTPTDCWELRAA